MVNKNDSENILIGIYNLQIFNFKNAREEFTFER